MRWRKLAALAFFLSATVYTARGVLPFSQTIDLRVMYIGLAALVLAVVGYDGLEVCTARAGVLQTPFTACLIMVLALGVYGFLVNPVIVSTAMDTATYLIVLCFVALGRHDEFWQDVEKPLLVLFWVAVGLTWVGVGTPDFEAQEVRSLYGITIDTPTDTLGYRIVGLLGLYPLLFALALTRNRFDAWALLGLGTLVVYLGFHVYFAKRAPVARAVSYAVFALVLMPALRGRRVSGWIILALIAFATVGFFSVDRYLPVLVAKYQMTDVSRLEEAKALASDLSPMEWLLGRGMGGTFTPPRHWRAGIIESGGMIARDSVHAGILLPVLKGGLLFALAYYSLFAKVIRLHPGAWYESRANFAASVALPVYGAFLFVEGPPSIANICDAVLVGLACGRGGRSVRLGEPRASAADSSPEHGAARGRSNS